MQRKYPQPQPGEYTPYTINYISLVPEDGLIEKHLEDGAENLKTLMRSFPVDKLTSPHAPGEWTIQDVLPHIIDTERVFSYRALRIARGDQTELPGYEQDDYASAAQANNRSLDNLLEEYEVVRRASLALIRSLTDEALSHIGYANKNPLSVRAAVYIIAGHELYHIRSIRENYC